MRPLLTSKQLSRDSLIFRKIDKSCLTYETQIDLKTLIYCHLKNVALLYIIIFRQFSLICQARKRGYRFLIFQFSSFTFLMYRDHETLFPFKVKFFFKKSQKISSKGLVMQSPHILTYKNWFYHDNLFCDLYNLTTLKITSVVLITLDERCSLWKLRLEVSELLVSIREKYYKRIEFIQMKNNWYDRCLS